MSGLVCAGALLTGLVGCTAAPLAPRGAPAPLSNPIPLGGTDARSGVLETERRAFLGTWDLATLEVAPPGATARVPVKASGTLVYDEFSNLTIDAHTTDAAAPVAAREASILSFKGRAVLDIARRELKLMNLTGNVNPDEVLSPERRRRYEFGDGTLTLSSFDDQGQVTSVAVWRRR